MSEATQYIVRTARGESYYRVELWEGGVSAARKGARRIGGYVVELDAYLCEKDKIVADFR